MLKLLRRVLFLFLSAVCLLLVSCAALTPTILPPLTQELGYHVPNFKGLTTTGLIRGTYRLEVEKLKLWKFSVDSILTATENARNGVIDFLTVVGLGGTAALPAALRRMPKGAISEEQHKHEIEKIKTEN